jgi:hypothetical protein
MEEVTLGPSQREGPEHMGPRLGWSLFVVYCVLGIVHTLGTQ